jgi:putative ABC transport system substrate-binding protein
VGKQFLWLMIFLCGISAGGVSEGREGRVFVLLNYESPQSKEMVEGFKAHLLSQDKSMKIETLSLSGEAKAGKRILEEMKKRKPDLIYAVGSLALDLTSAEIKDVPIIAGFVLRGEDLKGAPNLTGVSLEFPVEVQFRWMQRFLPSFNPIGVIYNPPENQKRIDEASRVASKMGLKLEAQAVSHPKDLPTAMNFMAKRAQVLWAIPDGMVLTPETVKHVLLFSFRNRIPLVGLSEAWVKAGALYALGWNFADLGSQCGEMAWKVLNGDKPSSIPPASPRKVVYSINLKIASHLKVDISEELVKGAKEVYQGDPS